MSEIDQQFIEYVVKSLVGKPDAVHIDRRIDEKGVLLELTVDPEDLGRVIGKRGATAQSLRTLLRALGTKNDARYNLKIIDNGPLDKGRGNDDKVPSDSGKPANDTGAAADDTEDTGAGDDTSDAPSEEPAEDAQSEEAPAPETPKEAPEKTPDEAPETTPASSDEDQAADRLAQTRRELADLDDLDV
jgi:uncharacterized protein